MSDGILEEEFEVLESIYPEELSKLSERQIQIDAEPDDLEDGEPPLKCSLLVEYPEEYPDVLPELSLEEIEGDFSEEEIEQLLQDLREVGNENLGMAMTFTLVSHLREQLSALVRSRSATREAAAMEKERLELEAEEARTRGTAVTRESFLSWKTQFDREMSQKKTREEEERLKGLTPKEREEWKRIGTRLSGRQLFERDKNLEADNLEEEGGDSVDVRQYERNRGDDEDEDERVTFSDSD